MYNECMDTCGKRVTLAPHKHMLNEYGGTMTRQEYSKDTRDVSVILPPIIPIDNTICDIQSVSHKKNGDLKLYRINPLKTNRVLDKMCV